MSDEDKKLDSAVEPDDLDWKEVSSALERLLGAQDALKRLGVPLRIVGRASILAAMNLQLVETEGDPFKATTLITEFMYRTWRPVCDGLKATAEAAIKDGALQKQRLSGTELESMKALISNMDMVLSSRHILSAEEIVDLLKAQTELSNVVSEHTQKFGPMAVVRSLIVMAQQFIFFDMQGDLLAAKTAFSDQQHVLWEVAVVNARSLIQKAVETAESDKAGKDKLN